MKKPGTATRRTGTVRCAIYTRKSSEEGLEQEFNSLQAQREACEAFIDSQRHEGWICLRASYDDGGFSGATMDRPALQQLLADITAGRVDTVVVYKIDRLTRSLADFAKIVEILDARGASFVSVTQQFNTTTSMGRLTLNVLLSFAQFEREVIGERIRDKIAASKKKGMWMGGVPPLGYGVRDHKLVMIDSEADTVRLIFRRYAELGSVRLLQAELEARGIRSKSWTSVSGRLVGGKPFSRGALYLMLQNRTYRAKSFTRANSILANTRRSSISHCGTPFRSSLPASTARRNCGRRTRQPSLLAGMLFDGDGNRMTPSHAGQERHALPLLCLRLADHERSDRDLRRVADPGGGDRAARQRPSAPMASRSRQHLQIDFRHGSWTHQCSSVFSRWPQTSASTGPSCPSPASVRSSLP